MVEREVVIRLEDGVHARPAAMFVQKANKFKAKIFIKKDDIEVNGKSIMNIMMLALTHGTTITIAAEGTDEDSACTTLADFIENNFDERK